MPELPEVETLRRQLEKAIVGKTIAKVEVLREKSFQGEKERLVGKTIREIKRGAKLLQINFTQGFPCVLIHLKLTGQLIFQAKNKRVFGGHPTPDWVEKLPSKHTRVMISFSDGSKLFFNDLRVFGWLKVVETKKELAQETKSFLGIEPLSKGFTVETLSELLKRTGRPIKLALMDQNLIAGVGNIYANEALWEAKILPQKTARRLTSHEIEKLRSTLEKVLLLGIKYGGASENTYRQLSGLGGKYQEHFLVYQRDGEKCKRCGETIKKMKLGGRGTFYCPKCQT